MARSSVPRATSFSCGKRRERNETLSLFTPYRSVSSDGSITILMSVMGCYFTLAFSDCVIICLSFMVSCSTTFRFSGLNRVAYCGFSSLYFILSGEP